MALQDTPSVSIDTGSLDTTDVPLVATRELALALKMLTSSRDHAMPVALSDLDLRQVEQLFWEISRRPRQRKVAVLLRFRSLVIACQTRRIRALLAAHGETATLLALEVAAKMRLNAKWGFNPVKLARAVSEGLCSPRATAIAA